MPARVKVLSTVALTPTLDELVPKYESGGNTADVIIPSRLVLDELESRGRLIAGSIVDIGTSYVAVFRNQIGRRQGKDIVQEGTTESRAHSQWSFTGDRQ